MSIVYIGIGSNLGKRQENCLKAIKLLNSNDLKVTKMSSIYETEPWGVKDQPRYKNMAVEIQTELSPKELLARLKKIEDEMGRADTIKWGPRIIDLDILLYDDLFMDEDELIIPHPLMHKRAFAIEPLSEIAPDTMHPVLQKKIRELFVEIK